MLIAICLVVGPIEPATNRGRSGVRSLNSSHARRAQATAAALISRTSSTRQLELLHADRAGAERVRLDDVGPGRQVAAMDLRDLVRVREAEDVGEVLEVLVMAGKPLAAHAALVQPERLDLRAHRAVEDQNPLGEQRFEQVGFVDDGLRGSWNLQSEITTEVDGSHGELPWDEGKQGFHGD